MNGKKVIAWFGGVLTITASVYLALVIKEGVDKRWLKKTAVIVPTSSAAAATPAATK